MFIWKGKSLRKAETLLHKNKRMGGFVLPDIKIYYKAHTTQSNLQIKCNPYQNTYDIFHRSRTNNLKICMEAQKTPNCQTKHSGEKRTELEELYSLASDYTTKL